MAVRKKKVAQKARRAKRASVSVMIKRYQRRLAKLKERAKLQEIKRQVADLQNEVDKGV